jgi:hypothetical protein
VDEEQRLARPGLGHAVTEAARRHVPDLHGGTLGRPVPRSGSPGVEREVHYR